MHLRMAQIVPTGSARVTGVADGGRGDGGLRRNFGANAIGGTVPASLSALTSLTYLCARPCPALALCAPARAGRMRGTGSRGVRRRRIGARQCGRALAATS